MPLGNAKNAAEAVKVSKRSAHLINWNRWSGQRKKKLEPGWYYIGHGDSRLALLGPDNIIYKVPNPKAPSYIRVRFDNLSEWNRYRELKNKLPAGFAFPKCKLYKPKGLHVIAMEYIGGKHLTESQANSAEVLCNGSDPILWDLHGGNIKLFNGVKYIIDFTH